MPDFHFKVISREPNNDEHQTLDFLSVHYQPSPDRFLKPVVDTDTTAGAGVFGDVASAPFGVIEIEQDMTLDRIEAHVLVDGTAGIGVFEVWFWRSGSIWHMADLTINPGGGSHQVYSFTLAAANFVNLNAGDRLYLQPTSVMTNGVVAIDVHYDSVAITANVTGVLAATLPMTL